jgi:hypothetical protein
MGTRLQTAPVCQFQHWGTKKNTECRGGDACQDFSRPCFVRADQRGPGTLLTFSSPSKLMQ